MLLIYIHICYAASLYTNNLLYENIMLTAFMKHSCWLLAFLLYTCSVFAIAVFLFFYV